MRRDCSTSGLTRSGTDSLVHISKNDDSELTESKSWDVRTHEKYRLDTVTMAAPYDVHRWGDMVGILKPQF